MSDSVRLHRRQPPVPGILQARTLEWVAISPSNAWKWKVKVKSLSRVWLPATPWTAAYQAPPSMGFSRQEYWSGVLLPSPYPNLVKKITGLQSSYVELLDVLQENVPASEDQCLWYRDISNREVAEKEIHEYIKKSHAPWSSQECKDSLIPIAPSIKSFSNYLVMVMVMDGNCAYCGYHFAICTNTESLHSTTETNIMLYVNYASVLKII